MEVQGDVAEEQEAEAVAREELRVEIKPAGDKGDGAFAAEAAAAGQWIGTYVGTPVTLLDTAQRYTDTDPEYLFQITPDLYLDAMDSTHFSRFFNHRYPDFNLNFTVDKAANRVDFYARRDIAVGEELSFDYGVGYWMGSGVVPLGDTRNYTVPKRDLSADNGPLPMTPTTRRADVEATMKLPEAEARAGLLRCLEYYGASRLPCATDEEPRMRIPLTLGADAAYEEVGVANAPLELLRSAAEACITCAAELDAARAAAADAQALEGEGALAEGEVQLARRFQARCPPFATRELNACGLAVLLLWSFPAEHGVTRKMTTEEWEELLAKVRAATVYTAGGGVADVLTDLEAYAPRERIDTLVDKTTLLSAEWLLEV